MSEIFKSLPFILGMVYLIALPIVVYGIAFLHKKLLIDRKAEKIKNRAELENLPKPLWGTWVQRIKITKSDKRSLAFGEKAVNLERRILFWSLYLLGLIAAVLGGVQKDYRIVIVGVVLFFISIIFGVRSSKSLMEERERIMSRMLEVGQSKLNLPKDSIVNQDVQVLEWQDFVSPQKVKYKVPTTFPESGAEGFLQQFNQVFGRVQEWVASEEDGGWDYEKGEVVLAAVPPLPTMAPWAEHYALAPGVADSFFPLAIGVTGGVEIPNPETGEVENVLGFDVGGKQMGEGKDAGLVVDGTLGSASPQTLMAGSTGSGKSLALTTPVVVYEPLDINENDTFENSEKPEEPE